MQGIFQKENTDKALKYGIYRHLPTYEKIIRNLVSFWNKNRGKFIITVRGKRCYKRKNRFGGQAGDSGSKKCIYGLWRS